MEGFKSLKYWITHEFYRAQFILLEPQRCLPPPTPSSPTLLDQELSEEKICLKVCVWIETDPAMHLLVLFSARYRQM